MIKKNPHKNTWKKKWKYKLHIRIQTFQNSQQIHNLNDTE